MFRRAAAPAAKDWDLLYFHEKLHHLVDRTAETIIQKCSWWVPAVMASVALNYFVFATAGSYEYGMACAEFPVAVFSALTPVARAPPCGYPQEDSLEGPADEEPEEME